MVEESPHHLQVSVEEFHIFVGEIYQAYFKQPHCSLRRFGRPGSARYHGSRRLVLAVPSLHFEIPGPYLPDQGIPGSTPRHRRLRSGNPEKDIPDHAEMAVAGNG